MRLSFIPREKIFYDLLEELAQKMQAAVVHFQQSVAQWDDSFGGVDALHRLEHECDELIHRIMLKLNTTFVTPIDGVDIHRLAKKMDDLVDILHAVMGRLVLFRIHAVTEEFKAMSGLVVQSGGHIVLLVQKLRKMNEPKEMLALCHAIGELETEGDRVFEKALGQLFQGTPDPLEVIKWKEIYTSLEEAIDTCEDIADTIEGIIVKYG